MTRMTNASDTLATARRLETDFGMDRRAAEGVATAINERFTENVATKADIELLKADIEKLATSTKAEIATLGAETKADSQRLDTKIEHLDEKLTGRIDNLKTTIGVSVAVATLILTAIQVYFGVR